MKYTEIKIIDAKILKPYLIEVRFNDNSSKQINLEPVLHGNLYSPLRKPELFKEMKLNQEIQTIEWPNGADFHPETLYNWNDYKDEMKEKAERWGQRTREFQKNEN